MKQSSKFSYGIYFSWSSIFFFISCITVSRLFAEGFPVQGTTFVTGQGWAQTVVTLTPDLCHSPKPAVAFNLQGMGICVWINDAGQKPYVQAALYNQKSSWSSAQVIGLNSLNAPDVLPQLALNDAGIALVVWRANNNSVQVVTYGIKGGWSAPKQLSSISTVGNPVVALNNNGDGAVAWVDGNGSVEVSRYMSGAGWSTPEIISLFGAESASPRLALNNDGTVVCVWQGVSMQTSQGVTLTNVQGAIYSTTQGWSPAQTLSSAWATANSPQVAINDSGNITCVWHASKNTEVIGWSSYTPNKGWSNPQVLNSTGVVSNNPQIALNSVGGALCGWNNGSTIQVASSSSQARWSSLQTLSPLNQNSLFNSSDAAGSNLALNDLGNAVVAWVNNGTGNAGLIQATTYSPSGGWSSPSTIGNTQGNGGYVSVAMNDIGNILAAFGGNS